MKVAIVKYTGGNTVSVTNALARIGAASVVTDSPELITKADRVIIPGVGEASTAMESLRAAGLCDVIRGLRQPLLGICLGMHLLCSRSEERDTECLGITADRAVKFSPGPMKVPHTGWNQIRRLSSPLFEGIDDGAYMYFVHSYYIPSRASAIAVTDYGVEFASALASDNFYGVQFHPEKSGRLGERLLQNFLEL